MGPSITAPLDDFRAHHDLLKDVTSNLGLKIEELKEPIDKVALAVHEGVIKLTKAL